MPKQTSWAKRYRVDAKPAEGSTWVRVGRNHYARSAIDATFTPFGSDADAPVISMLIRIDAHGVPQAYCVTALGGDTPLSPESTRIPLRAMIRAAVACLSYTLEGDSARMVALSGDPFEIGSRTSAPLHADLKHWKALERDVRRAPANRVTDDDLRRTAEIVRSVPYRDRRAAVSAALSVSLPVAKSRIAAARQAGYLSDREESEDAE